MTSRTQNPKPRGRQAASGGHDTARSAAHVAGGGWFDLREPYLVPAVVALAFRIYWAILLQSAAEDAYITFRFAENWAAGLGPVYNEGERVMGYSSPLWTAWLAVGALLSKSAFLWSRAWGIVFDVAAVVIGARVLRQEAGRWAAWGFALFYAVFPIFAATSVLGMETSLYAFLVIAAAAATRSASPLGGGVLGLLALTRPEAIVSAAIVALGASWRQRLVAIGVFAAAVASLTLYYGTPIPASVSGKAVTYGTQGLDGAWVWLAGFVPGLFASWPTTTEGQHLVVLSIVLTPAALVAAWQTWNRPGAVRLVAAASLAVLAGYSVLGVPFFAWYLVIPLLGWAWLAAVGLPTISRHPLLWASILLFAVVDVVPMRSLYGGRVWAEEGFRGTGVWLRDLSRGEGTVFLEPIGHIGYVSGLRVIDEVGLVSPSVRDRRARGDGWYYDTVIEEEPDYLIVRPGQLEGNRAWAGRGSPFRTAAERDRVLALYDHAFSGPDYEKMPMRILARRATTPAPPEGSPQRSP